MGVLVSLCGYSCLWSSWLQTTGVMVTVAIWGCRAAALSSSDCCHGVTGLCMLPVKVLVTQLCLTVCNSITVARWAPLSMEFCRQEYWSGLPFPSPGDLPDLGIKPRYPALQVDSYCLSRQGSPDLLILTKNQKLYKSNKIHFQASLGESLLGCFSNQLH